MANPPQGYDSWQDFLDNMPPPPCTAFFDRYGYPGGTLEELMENVGKPLSWDLIERQRAAEEEEEADDENV